MNVGLPLTRDVRTLVILLERMSHWKLFLSIKIAGNNTGVNTNRCVLAR